MAKDNDQKKHKSDAIDSSEEISEDQEKSDLAAGMDSKLLQRLSLAKSKRLQAEASRQQVAKEIEKATRELYKNLILEGERALEEANHVMTEAHLMRIEVQKELEHARVTRAEADAYHEKTIGEIRRYAQQARATKAEAVAYREQLLSDVRQQAEEELGQAKDSIVAADSYCEQVLTEAQRQAEAIICEAVSIAEREGNQIRQRSLLESKKMLAQIELMKVTAQDELEAQKLDAESAALKAESQNVLRLAEAKLENEIPDKELNLAPSAPPEAGKDWPLSDDELIFGLEIAGFSKAYPIRVLSNQGSINDSIGGHGVLLNYDTPLGAGAVFQRAVQDRCLTFNLCSRSDDDVMLLRDQETETIWEALTGRATGGPLKGTRLQPLDYECSIWFAWNDLHPNTEVYVD